MAKVYPWDTGTSAAASATGLKNAQSASAAENFVKNLEQAYMASKGGEYSGLGARVSGAKKNILGELGLNAPAKVYNDSRKGFAATLKSLTGDTGVMTDQDYARLAGLLPTLSSTPEEAMMKFEQLRGQITAKFGGSGAKTGYVPPENKGGLAASIVPGLAGLYGQKQKEVGASLEKLQKGDIVGYLKDVGKESIKNAFPITNIYDPVKAIQEKSIGAGYNPTGAQAAGEVWSILGMADLAKAYGPKLKEGVKNVFTDKVIPPQQTPDILNEGIKTATKGSTVRDKAISLAEETGKKVKGDTILKDVKSWAKEASRTASTSQKAQIDDFVTGISKSLKGKDVNPTTAKSIWDNARKGFSAAGKSGNTIEAGFNRAVRDGTRTALENVAPGFEKGTALIRTGLEKEKIYGAIRKSIEKTALKTSLNPQTVEPSKAIKAVRTVLKGAGITVSTVALMKILGLTAKK